VLFAGKTVWSMPERFECTTLAKKALYKYSSFPFLSFPTSRESNDFKNVRQMAPDILL